MSEAKPQDGSTVKGYRTLTPADIEMMNEVKAVSREFLKKLDFLKFVHDSAPDADPQTLRWLAGWLAGYCPHRYADSLHGSVPRYCSP